MKTCTKCQEDKPLSDFRRFRDGLHPSCRECERKYRAGYYQQNKERIKARDLTPEKVEEKRKYREDYYRRNKESFLSKQREFYNQPENRARRIFIKAKERAKDVGIEFSIELEDIIIPDNCPYLNIPLTHLLGSGQLKTNSSIDRIDSNKGYIKGNVRIISRLANSMKTDSTREQRVAFAKAILNDETL